MSRRVVTLLLSVLVLGATLAPATRAATEATWSVGTVSRLKAFVGPGSGHEAVLFLANDTGIKTGDDGIDRVLDWLGFSGVYSQRIGWGMPGPANVGATPGGVECGTLVVFCDPGSRSGIVFGSLRGELRLTATSDYSVVALWRNADGGTVAFDVVYLTTIFALDQVLPDSISSDLVLQIAGALQSYGHELAAAVQTGDIWSVKDVIVAIGEAVFDLAVQLYVAHGDQVNADMVRDFGSDFFKKAFFGLQLAVFGGQLGLSVINAATNVDWSGGDAYRASFDAEYGSAASDPPTPTAMATPVASALTPSPTASAPTKEAVTTDVPVIACATSYGSGEIQEPTEPSAQLTLPAAAVGRLAVFATNQDRVLAPLGWRCVADVGANGTAALTLSPGSDDPAAIIVEDAAVSYAYVLELACPLFPAAARLLKHDFDEGCPKPPAHEVVRHDKQYLKTVARFEDPSGVAGTGTGSGGEYAAIGAIWFGREISGAKITCLLRPEDRDLCGVVVDDWLGRYGFAPSH